MTAAKKKKKPLRGKNSPTNRYRMMATKRALSAMDMRTAGATYQQIADSLGYKDKSSAFDAIRSLIKSQKIEHVAHMRQVESARLEKLWFSMYPLAQRGDTKAAGVCVRICRHRAALFGLHRAKKIQLSGKVNVAPAIKIYAGFNPAEIVSPSINGASGDGVQVTDGRQ